MNAYFYTLLTVASLTVSLQAAQQSIHSKESTPKLDQYTDITWYPLYCSTHPELNSWLSERAGKALINIPTQSRSFKHYLSLQACHSETPAPQHTTVDRSTSIEVQCRIQHEVSAKAGNQLYTWTFSEPTLTSKTIGLGTVSHYNQEGVLKRSALKKSTLACFIEWLGSYGYFKRNQENIVLLVHESK